jgi:hypothetical protein
MEVALTNYLAESAVICTTGQKIRKETTFHTLYLIINPNAHYSYVRLQNIKRYWQCFEIKQIEDIRWSVAVERAAV